MLRKLIISVLFLYLSSAGLYAQLSVSATSNANALVNNIVGSGVIVTNVTLNCNGQATGTFSSSGTNLGLSSGIILATGAVSQASSPNNSPGDFSVFSNSNCFSSPASFFDANLASIEPQAKFDGCVLEFDIKPVCNTLQINYVFASEEYPEYVCSDYNDAFGFFIWGPNPSGGSYAGYNIARLPSGQPVSINTVNGGSPGAPDFTNCGSLSNTSFYVNNNGGSSIQYDGFTTPLTASASVTQCQNYHLKLAIADAGDCHFSSAVFLSNKGITCPASQVPQLATTSTPLNCGNDGTATVNVTNGQGNITYNWQPGGQTTATATNLGAGTYTCTVGYTLPCPYTQTITANVSGNNVLTLNTSSLNAYCDNASGSAAVNVVGGSPPYTTPQWSTMPVQNGANATGLLPGTYTVSVTDATGCTVTKAVTVGNTTPNISIEYSTLQSTCGSANGDITISNVSGGTGPYSYSWNTTPVSTSQSLNNIISGLYTLIVTDVDNCKAVKDITLVNADSLLIDINSINEYCNQQNGEIHVPVINGIAPFTWSWSHSATLNDSIATNLAAGIYSFTVTDNVGCISRGTVVIANIRDVFDGTIYTLPPEPIVNSNFILGVTLPVSWTLNYIELDDGSIRSGDTETTLFYSEYGLYDATFFVESINGCKDTIPYSIFVKDFMTIYIPNAFTPNRDRTNKVWYVYGTLVKKINIYVYDRWGLKLFESHDLESGWDGMYKGALCQEDVYVYKVEAIDFFNEEFKFVGHITLIR